MKAAAQRAAAPPARSLAHGRALHGLLGREQAAVAAAAPVGSEPRSATGSAWRGSALASAVVAAAAMNRRRWHGRGASQCSAVRTAPVARRALATAVAVQAPSASVGTKLHGWTCVRVEDLQELKCSGLLWQHDKTGAELLSVEQPLEENKTFGVVFRTPPESSNGIAHVLEHSVLCGSRKYPVKDPFAELLKGSVQTFLNAMTFPDRTCYPVASCNLQDFYNLVDVYLDAVLHPRALTDPRVLAQEGWHYELEDKEKPLNFKGVVFNEMKGVYSNPDSLQSRTLLNKLLPDTPYGVDSGGDPKEIPDLTFDYFKGFHGRFYHPSNAKFWFYGDDAPERRLQLLDEYLREFQRQEVTSSIPLQPLWKEPRSVAHNFAVGADEDISKKSMMCVSWVLSDSKPDLETAFALDILNYVIMGTPGAPLRKALTDSGLGSRVIGGGLYDGLVQPTFSVGLKDIREADVPVVEKIVMDTLRRLADDGLEREAIEAALNRTEFANRELNTGGFPRGLSLMFSAVGNWNYGKDPFEALRYEAPLQALRAKLVDRKEAYLEQLIRTRLLDNPHRLLVTSKPSAEEGPKTEAEEKERLQRHKESLSDEQLQGIIDATAELKQLQEAADPPELLAKIPRLELSDIPKESPKIPTEVSTVGPTTVLKHPLLTSGVVYVDVAFDLSTVPAELLPFLPIFCRGMKEMGTAKSDFVQLQRRADLSTGGISASPLVSAKRNSTEPVASLVMRGKAMHSKLDCLLDLMAEMSTEVRWNNRERFIQLAKEARAGGRSQLLSSGHVIAASRLARNLSKAGWASEQMSGLAQFEFIGSVLARAESDWPSVEAQLLQLQSCIFNQACVVNLTADADALPSLDGPVKGFLSRLPTAGSRPASSWSPPLEPVSEGIIVPSQVNYVGKGANLYSSTDYKLHGSSLVVSKLLGTGYLWDKVRVIGGAYGGFCRFDPRSGDFKYLSYRDPNLQSTLDNYDAAPKFLQEFDLTEDELTKSILGTMGDVDSHQLPDAKGYTALQRFLLGETDAMRQEMRDQILGTTADDIRRFAAALDAVRTKGHVCIVGSEAAIKEKAEALALSVSRPLAAEEGPKQ